MVEGVEVVHDFVQFLSSVCGCSCGCGCGYVRIMC